MAETKTSKLEREYIIPLRRECMKVPQYRRTGRAVKAIKKFIAKHMKVPDRDLEKVKLDIYFNNNLWFRGRASPPSKIKVKATKEGDIVNVTFVEIPQHVKFLKARHERLSKEAERAAPKEVAEAAKAEEKPAEKTEEQKKDESEKEKSVAESKAAEIKQEAKAQKHSTKPKKVQHPQRMALQK
jgi:large subunit ribosomal protein L31e